MNQDFSRSLRDVGCLHPHKQERWPFPRAPWHEHNFPGRDAKAQEFTPRMSCFPISRSRLTRCDGNPAAGRGHLQISCVVAAGAPGRQCRGALPRQAAPAAAHSRLSRKPGMPLSDAGRARRMRMLRGGFDLSPRAASPDIHRMRLGSSSWSQGTWIISLGQIPPCSASSGSCSCFWRQLG